MGREGDGMVTKRQCGEAAVLLAEVILILTLFYKNILFVMMLGVPVFFLGFVKLRREWEVRRRWQMNLEFKEGLQGIAAALSAGYSIENAIGESKKDLEVLYGKDSVLCQEFQIIMAQLELNRPIETVFDEFARRSKVEDIQSFAEVFRTARRSGGDLVAITKMTSDRIGEKIEVKREINTLLAGKKMEGQIMNLVPLGMILYFWLCSPGFLDCLYEGLKGRLVMSVFLVVYLLAYGMNQKICSIAV